MSTLNHPPMEMEYSLAPMAGYTDLPFRRMCRKFGLYRGTTALIDAGALVHGNPDSAAILHRGEEEEWLQVQLLGSIPGDVRQAATILRDGEWHFERLDFNMGCPVRKVLKRHAGAALMKYQDLALECLKILRDIWPGELTVKTRILDEDGAPERTVEFTQMLQSVGINGITIHGRLAEKIYSGPVQYQVIRAVRENLHIPVTANGGVFCREDALKLAHETGCQRIMVARGCLGNPWIFGEVQQENFTPPTRREILQCMHCHMEEMLREYGESAAMILGRKIISGYICGRGFPREIRASVVKVATWNDFMTLEKQLDEWLLRQE